MICLVPVKPLGSIGSYVHVETVTKRAPVTRSSLSELPPSLQAVMAVRQAGFGVTIHAGEDQNTGGLASNVRVAIEGYGATRIGHGYLALADEDVMQLVQRSGSHFECCPSSSYLTGGFAPRPRPWSDHPLRQLYERGISCSVNTDDPLMCGVCELSYHIA